MAQAYPLPARRLQARPTNAMAGDGAPGRGNAGGTLKLLNLTKRVQDLAQMTKLYSVFDVYEDEASAVLSFA